MTNDQLAQSYLKMSNERMKALPLFYQNKAYAVVIREAQEIVELTLKGLLRFTGIDPPKWHDVGEIIKEYSNRFPDEISKKASRIIEISRWLRKERELSFYGDIDYVPTEIYREEDAKLAIEDATYIVQIVIKHFSNIK